MHEILKCTCKTGVSDDCYVSKTVQSGGVPGPVDQQASLLTPTSGALSMNPITVLAPDLVIS